MCLGYPAMVVDIDLGNGAATVIDRGLRRSASTLMADHVAVGDWVFVAAGNVIRRLDPDDAAALAASITRAERITAGSTAMPVGDAVPSSTRHPLGDTL